MGTDADADKGCAVFTVGVLIALLLILPPSLLWNWPVDMRSKKMAPKPPVTNKRAWIEITIQRGK